MKKQILFYSIILLAATPMVIARDGGALGVQFGGITFGLGGSSEGPIIGVGHSPDNDLSFSAVIVPGGYDDCHKCGDREHRRHHRRECNSCVRQA